MIKCFNLRFFIVERDEIPLNRAWKMFVKNTLSNYTNKTFENSDTCNFFINITLDYEQDIEVLTIKAKIFIKIT